MPAIFIALQPKNKMLKMIYKKCFSLVTSSLTTALIKYPILKLNVVYYKFPLRLKSNN